MNEMKITTTQLIEYARNSEGHLFDYSWCMKKVSKDKCLQQFGEFPVGYGGHYENRIGTLVLGL